ncbi:MAG: NBR1-Ig-like domain-containing protein [Anaerolineales bacterium]|jgi:hypothetical protein|nr:NBR1-Ig-like domain-containing protein [Anaerolineales bacterium]MDX9936545.1 NBR1-Ig-like domain-containing protein [Anaerolineales bacterium]GER80365.1 conserved hypothetical protein [Candidatus Denitrolinea symbiosum]
MTKPKNLWLPVLIVLALTLSACGGKSKEPTPTPVDPNLIAAQAIATFAMGLTQTALANPTETPTLTLTPTEMPTFAPLSTNTPAVAPTSSCDVSLFIADVTVPDGTPVAPGQAVDKTWRIQNGGTCTWTATYKAVFTGVGNGGPMGGATTPIGKTVKPGESIEITIHFVAPTTPGDYTSWWKLQNDAGAFFGTPLSVAIKVVGSAPAATAAPTEEPTEAPTTQEP